MSSSFDEFLREMEDEARQAGPEAEAAFFESQQRHWIGRRLFERRRELGYTQAKLSALSGINQADISKIEHAEANPTLETLAALVTPLGLTIVLEPVNKATRPFSALRQPGRARKAEADRAATGPGEPALAPRSAAAGPRPRGVSPASSTQGSTSVSADADPPKRRARAS